MRARGLILAICSALAAGCTGQPEEPRAAETREIIDNLVQAGFRADDIMIVDDKVYVGRDAEVSLAASREMLETPDGSQEHYRTTNQILRPIFRLCISAPGFTGDFSTALDLAIQNYDDVRLRFGVWRAPASSCSFTINAVIDPNLNGGVSGFPSDGWPYSTITIGGQLAAYGVDVIEHVITHELGHALGFRHTDYFNPAISCGSGSNEGDAGVGAIHVPGTSTGATVGGSVFNSCFRTTETGELSTLDVIAVGTLFGEPGGWRHHVAYQASDGKLAIQWSNTGLSMAPGTSPSITRLTSGEYQVAFQASNGNLWTKGPAGTVDLGFGMAAGTSPSITALPSNGYQIAFQANTGLLWYTGSAGTAATAYGMAAGTSPTIAALPNGSFQMAFQANTGLLWTATPTSGGSLGYGMALGTSPSITTFSGGEYLVAFQASNGTLAWTGDLTTSLTQVPMAAGTNPSATTLTNGTFQIAYQAVGGKLSYAGQGTGTTTHSMASGSSPSIAPRWNGGFDVLFKGSTGTLWNAGSTGAGNNTRVIAAGTSPAVR